MDKSQKLQQRCVIDAASTIRCAALALQGLPMGTTLQQSTDGIVCQLYDICETLYLLAGREDLIPKYSDE